MKYLIFYGLLYVGTVNCYKILGIFPHTGKSHFHVFIHLMKGLCDLGHEITVVSYFPSEQETSRFKHVNLADDITGYNEIFNMDLFYGKDYMKYFVHSRLAKTANSSCESGLRSKAFQNFLKTKQTFDVVIVEFFNTDCYLPVLEKFNNPPLIGFSSCGLMPWTSNRFGTPSNPAYIPNNLLDMSDKLTFFKRVENTFVTFLQNTYYKFVVTKNDERIARNIFGEQITPLQTVVTNSSLLLVNTHPSLNLPKPLTPNIIEVGGIHVGKQQKLPEHLEKWINESTEGVIYFSLGSLIKGHTFPEDKKEAFLKAFARLPQRILWKWENDTMLGKPDNVMLSKWTPQFDVLCHPNVKAFISHGGLLGTIEAVHCGVPVMVMPQFGDQFVNSRALEANGGGIVMHLYDATEEKVYKNLKKLTSTSFRMKAKELSERFKDRPLPPMETAIYWVEYVVRHKGAHFLRTAAVNMPFYQYYLIDVFAFSFVLIAFTFYAFLLLTRCIIRKFASTSTKEKLKTK